MDVLEELPAEVDHLLHTLSTLSVGGESYGFSDFALTQYITWMFVAIMVLTVVMTLAVRRLKMVPESRISNAVEALAEFIRNDIAVAMIGHDGSKYFPFIASVFFFILVNNLLGLIPGGKPGTGTMGITVALSTAVFIYYNYQGFKHRGFAGYIKSFVPHGVPGPIAPLIWVIEVFSSFLRLFTLSVRLFANMFAGHIILGIFAILTSLFVGPAIEHLSGATVAGALPSLGWMLLMTALYLLEVLVAFVQAYVFTLLTAVYIGGAVQEH